MSTILEGDGDVNESWQWSQGGRVLFLETTPQGFTVTVTVQGDGGFGCSRNVVALLAE